MSALIPFLRPLLGTVALALFVTNFFVSLSRTSDAPVQERVLRAEQVTLQVPHSPCDELEEASKMLSAELLRATQEVERTVQRTARVELPEVPLPAIAPCPETS